MDNLLNVTDRAVFDNAISAIETHSYIPFNNNFSTSDSIHIVINQNDSMIQLASSYLYIEGTFLKSADKMPSTKSKLTNNGISYLFDEVKYLMNNQVVDCVKDVGTASTMKAYASFNKDSSQASSHTGWDQKSQLIPTGTFNFCLPLKSILGIAEDFQKILINAKHELILIRSRTNDNAYETVDNEEMDLTLTKIVWKVDHVRLNDMEKLRMLKTIELNKTLEVCFRSWDFHLNPGLPQSQSLLWNLKTSSNLERPRFIIIGFQTDRKNKSNKNCSVFDHVNVRSLKVKLNSEVYPYEDFNIDYDLNNYGICYQLYSQFQQSYYGQPNKPLLNYTDFKSVAPLFVVDCSRQAESIRDGSVDVKIMIETTINIPKNTHCYALIINDKILQYQPLTGIVKIL